MATLPSLYHLTPEILAPFHVYSTLSNTDDSLLPQLAHRIHLVKDIFSIPLGAKVLEIGPGQGDCTIVLAAAVGDGGRVDAIDPGDLKYGSPRTLGEAQAHIEAGPLGHRINFIRADPVQFLREQLHSSTAPESQSVDYTHILLVHSLWYFASAARIAELFDQLLKLRRRQQGDSVHVLGTEGTSPSSSPEICIASPILTARTPAQTPHLLAAFLRGYMTLIDPVAADRSNIRTPVSPAWMRRWFAAHGEKEKGTERIVRAGAAGGSGNGKAGKGLRDGVWEVQAVMREGFLGEVAEVARGRGDGDVPLLEGIRDAILESVERLDGGVEDVECMDIWTCVF